MLFFLCRYQNDDYSEPSGGPGPSQFDAFCRITDTFVKAGSREEVNLRYRYTTYDSFQTLLTVLYMSIILFPDFLLSPEIIFRLY